VCEQAKNDLKKATTEGVLTDAKQKEFTKLTQDRERMQKELDQVPLSPTILNPNRKS